MEKEVVYMEPDKYYHVFNRACGFEKLFMCDANFRFFMEKFTENLDGCVSLYAYCLIPNHFHFLIKTNTLNGEENPGEIYSRKFTNFFISYAKSFNKFNKRKGSLFSQNYKKKEIDSTEYLRTVILYIHQNPVNHGLVERIDNWKYSSYQEVTTGKRVFCKENSELIELFRSIEILRFCHKIRINIDLD